MSLFNLSQAYEVARLRARLAEDQERELEELLAQWFLDSHEGARAFLREIAKDHREQHPIRPVESAPQHVARKQNGGIRHAPSAQDLVDNRAHSMPGSQEPSYVEPRPAGMAARESRGDAS